MELKSIDDLKGCPRNPRRITGEALAGLKVSLAAFGDIGGLVWNARTGELVAGHQRLRALRMLYGAELRLVGEELVAPTGERWPVRVVDWDEGTAMAALVAANNPSIAGEFDDGLDALLKELEANDAELFAGLRLDDLVKDLDRVPTAIDLDEVPEEFPEPMTRKGDVWMMGPHVLVCGDATSASDVSRLMSSQGSGDSVPTRARMAFTDPPYNVGYEGEAGSIANDDLGKGFEDFILQAIKNLLARTDGAVYVCMSSSELDTLQTAFRLAGGHWSTFLIWAKDSFTIGRSDYQRQYEPILYGWRQGTDRHWCGDRDQGDVWLCDRPRVSKLHPTMKPVELIVRAIRNSCEAGDVVLDLFGGSGSTVIACEATGRVARVLELEPRFCDVIVQRWERFTGRKATRAAEALL